MLKFLAIGVLSLSTLTFGCTSEKMTHAPTGDNCPENVAYLQEGVNKYQKELGAYPADVQLLLSSKDGKGPFVEKVPECPSGNIYVIDNGIVREAPAK